MLFQIQQGFTQPGTASSIVSMITKGQQDAKLEGHVYQATEGRNINTDKTKKVGEEANQCVPI